MDKHYVSPRCVVPAIRTFPPSLILTQNPLPRTPFTSFPLLICLPMLWWSPLSLGGDLVPVHTKDLYLFLSHMQPSYSYPPTNPWQPSSLPSYLLSLAPQVCTQDPC